jgi:hypothetical protein
MLSGPVVLQQADYIGHFMDVAGDELVKPIVSSASGTTGVSAQRLRALLELSIRSSSAAGDPFKVRYSFLLMWLACVLLCVFV